MSGRDTDLTHLHPEYRSRIIRVLERLRAEGIPFKIFEGWRSPTRQNELFAQGRTTKGAKVTNARAWQSYHQYGLSADLVLFIGGQWSWDTSGPEARYWERLKQIGREEGLESLSWELPHLQLAGLKLADLRAGRYPEGGDASWAENLAAAIRKSPKGAPPIPKIAPERPPLPEDAPEEDEEPAAVPAQETAAVEGPTPDSSAATSDTTVNVETAGTVTVAETATPPPVEGGGPKDVAVKANESSLITKIQFWAKSALKVGGTASGAVGATTAGVSALGTLSERAQILVIYTGLGLIALIVVGAAVYFIVGAIGALVDHLQSKYFRARGDLANVK